MGLGPESKLGYFSILHVYKYEIYLYELFTEMNFVSFIIKRYRNARDFYFVIEKTVLGMKPPLPAGRLNISL